MATAVRLLRKWGRQVGTRANARNVKTLLQHLEKEAVDLAAVREAFARQQEQRGAEDGGPSKGAADDTARAEGGSTAPPAAAADKDKDEEEEEVTEEIVEGKAFMLEYAWALFRWWAQRAPAPAAPNAPPAHTFDADVLKRTDGMMEYVEFVEATLAAVNGKQLGVFPLRHVLQTYSDELREGAWLEFGVASGKSLRIMAAHGGRGQRIVGFDSFLGLPCKWREGFGVGRFSTGGVPPDVLLQQLAGGEAPQEGKTEVDLQFVTGWFEETVDEFCAACVREGQRIALVHIDCDVYSSTRTVLTALGEHGCLGRSCLFVFDELVNYGDCERHELKALYEFCNAYGYAPEWIGVERRGCLPAACRLTQTQTASSDPNRKRQRIA